MPVTETRPISSMTPAQAAEQGYKYSGAIGYYKSTPDASPAPAPSRSSSLGSSGGGGSSPSAPAAPVDVKPLASMTKAEAEAQGYKYSGAVGWVRDSSSPTAPAQASAADKAAAASKLFGQSYPSSYAEAARQAEYDALVGRIKSSNPGAVVAKPSEVDAFKNYVPAAAIYGAAKDTGRTQYFGLVHEDTTPTESRVSIMYNKDAGDAFSSGTAQMIASQKAAYESAGYKFAGSSSTGKSVTYDFFASAPAGMQFTNTVSKNTPLNLAVQERSVEGVVLVPVTSYFRSTETAPNAPTVMANISSKSNAPKSGLIEPRNDITSANSATPVTNTAAMRSILDLGNIRFNKFENVTPTHIAPSNSQNFMVQPLETPSYVQSAISAYKSSSIFQNAANELVVPISARLSAFYHGKSWSETTQEYLTQGFARTEAEGGVTLKSAVVGGLSSPVGELGTFVFGMGAIGKLGVAGLSIGGRSVLSAGTAKLAVSATGTYFVATQAAKIYETSKFDPAEAKAILTHDVLLLGIGTAAGFAGARSASKSLTPSSSVERSEIFTPQNAGVGSKAYGQADILTVSKPGGPFAETHVSGIQQLKAMMQRGDVTAGKSVEAYKANIQVSTPTGKGGYSVREYDTFLLSEATSVSSPKFTIFQRIGAAFRQGRGKPESFFAEQGKAKPYVENTLDAGAAQRSGFEFNLAKKSEYAVAGKSAGKQGEAIFAGRTTVYETKPFMESAGGNVEVIRANKPTGTTTATMQKTTQKAAIDEFVNVQSRATQQAASLAEKLVGETKPSASMTPALASVPAMSAGQFVQQSPFGTSYFPNNNPFTSPQKTIVQKANQNIEPVNIGISTRESQKVAILPVAPEQNFPQVNFGMGRMQAPGLQVNEPELSIAPSLASQSPSLQSKYPEVTPSIPVWFERSVIQKDVTATNLIVATRQNTGVVQRQVQAIHTVFQPAYPIVPPFSPEKPPVTPFGGGGRRFSFGTRQSPNLSLKGIRRTMKHGLRPLADLLSVTHEEAQTRQPARHLAPTAKVKAAFSRALTRQGVGMRFPTAAQARGEKEKSISGRKWF